MKKTLKKICLFIFILSIIYVSRSEFICISEFDCSYNGICNTNSECICDKGYTTWNSDIQCNYKQKSVVIAFILHIFLFFIGGGEWYLGNIILAFIPIILSTIIVLLHYNILVAFIYNKIGEEYAQRFINFLYILFSLTLFMWFFIELIYIGDGTRRDHNNVQTYI